MPRRSKRLQALSQAPSVGAVSSHEEPSAVLRWFLTHEDGMHMSMLTRFLGGADLFWLALASKSVLRGVRKDVLLQHGGADADTQCLWRLLAQRAERERPRSFGRGGARFEPGEQRTCYVAANGRVHALALADGSKLWSSEMRYAMDEGEDEDGIVHCVNCIVLSADGRTAYVLAYEHAHDGDVRALRPDKPQRHHVDDLFG